jgi:hypothetical protein
MKTKTLLSLILAFGFLTYCTTSSTRSRAISANHSSKLGPANPKPGSCYAKCLMPDQMSTNSQLIAVFTGDETKEDVKIETREITISPTAKKWEKKPSTRDCLSDDPNDCLVWCIVDVPAKIETYKILLDTTQSPNFEMMDIKQEKLVSKGGYTEWKETLCENRITKALINKLQTSLKNQNFYTAEVNSTLDTKTKAALADYQRANYLPVGQLDFETLNALGIDY